MDQADKVACVMMHGVGILVSPAPLAMTVIRALVRFHVLPTKHVIMWGVARWMEPVSASLHSIAAELKKYSARS